MQNNLYHLLIVWLRRENSLCLCTLKITIYFTYFSKIVFQLLMSLQERDYIIITISIFSSVYFNRFEWLINTFSLIGIILTMLFIIICQTIFWDFTSNTSYLEFLHAIHSPPGIYLHIQSYKTQIFINL